MTTVTGLPPSRSASASEAYGERSRAHATNLMYLALLGGILVLGVAVGLGPMVGAAALIALVGAIAIIQYPAAGTIMMVGLVPAIAGVSRGFPIPGLRLSEVLIVGVSMIVLLVTPAAPRSRWRALDWLALTYALVTVVFGLMATARQDITLNSEDIGNLLGPLQFFLMYRAIVVGLNTPKARSRAIDALMIASIPVSLLAVLQFLKVGPVVSFLATITGADFTDRAQWHALVRVSGPFPHWTVLGGYEFVIVILCAALIINAPQRHSKLLMWSAFGMAFLALILTLTFGSILGALVGVVLLATGMRRPVLSLGLVLAVGVIALAAASPVLGPRVAEQLSGPREGNSILPATVSARVSYWGTQYIPALRGHWSTGYGPELPASIMWQFTESVYIAMLMRGGLPLLLAYLALMYGAFRAGRQRIRSPDENQRAMARATTILVGVLAVMQITAPQFTLTGGPHLVWAIWALMIGGSMQARGPRAASQVR